MVTDRGKLGKYYKPLGIVKGVAIMFRNNFQIRIFLDFELNRKYV